MNTTYTQKKKKEKTTFPTYSLHKFLMTGGPSFLLLCLFIQ